MVLVAVAAPPAQARWRRAKATPTPAPTATPTPDPLASLPDPPFVESDAPSTRAPSAEALIFQAYKPVLATITAQRDPAHGGASQGSAFVLHASGLLLTSDHVVSDSDEIVVRFNDGVPRPAKLAAADPALDLAVLRIDPPGGKPLTPAVLGNSDAAREGDPIVALGMPLGLGATITRGILSGKDRRVDVGTVGAAGSPVAFLQTDAAINPGSSGGPIVDLDGRVIGVTTATIPSARGVSFAIPINAVKRALPALLRAGLAGHAWLGMTLGAANGSGAEVIGIRHQGPADQAGLQTGDIVTAIRGHDISSDADVAAATRDIVPHETVRIAYRRHGRVARVDVTATEIPVRGPGDAVIFAGALLSEFNPDSPESVTAGRHFGGGSGVFFDSVPKGSPAEKAGVQEGDVLMVLGMDSVGDLDDVRVLLDRELGDEQFKVLVQRGEKQITVILPR